jgi:H+/Cl- antiporter ClcA
VGGGIGVAGVVATSFPYLIPPDPKTTRIPLQPPFTSGSLHPFIWVVLLSIVFGFVGAGVVKVLTSPRSDKRAKLKSSTNNKLLNQANIPEVGEVKGLQHKAEFSSEQSRK